MDVIIYTYVLTLMQHCMYIELPMQGIYIMYDISFQDRVESVNSTDLTAQSDFQTASSSLQLYRIQMLQ